MKVYLHLWTREPMFSNYTHLCRIKAKVLRLQFRYSILESVDKGANHLKLQSMKVYSLGQGANVLLLQSKYTRICGQESQCSQATIQAASQLWTRGPLFSSYSPGIFTSLDQKATVLQLQSRYTRIYRPRGQSSQATVKAVSSMDQSIDLRPQSGF